MTYKQCKKFEILIITSIGQPNIRITRILSMLFETPFHVRNIYDAHRPYQSPFCERQSVCMTARRRPGKELSGRDKLKLRKREQFLESMRAIIRFSLYFQQQLLIHSCDYSNFGISITDNGGDLKKIKNTIEAVAKNPENSQLMTGLLIYMKDKLRFQYFVRLLCYIYHANRRSGALITKLGIFNELIGEMGQQEHGQQFVDTGLELIGRIVSGLGEEDFKFVNFRALRELIEGLIEIPHSRVHAWRRIIVLLSCLPRSKQKTSIILVILNQKEDPTSPILSLLSQIVINYCRINDIPLIKQHYHKLQSNSLVNLIEKCVLLLKLSKKVTQLIQETKSELQKQAKSKSLDPQKYASYLQLINLKLKISETVIQKNPNK